MPAILQRIGYAMEALRDSRPMTAQPVRNAIFFLVPEAVSWTVSPAEFRWKELSFFARRQDWGPVRANLIHEEYGFVPDLVKHRREPIIIDAGANIGTFAMFMLHHFPRARVFSYEPGPCTFDLLSRNCQLNPSFDWKASHTAIWKQTGQATFLTASRFSTESRLSGSGGHTVPAITLTDILEKDVRATVDLLKMDIEGSEEDVLSESEEALSRIDKIVVQLHPKLMNAQRVIDILERRYSHVYQVQGLRSSNPVYVGMDSVPS